MGVRGAEIPVSLLLAHIRGSTTIGEHVSSTEYRAFLDRSSRLSSQAVFAHDGSSISSLATRSSGCSFVASVVTVTRPQRWPRAATF
jgi:class 3 adenylate cyclase